MPKIRMGKTRRERMSGVHENRFTNRVRREARHFTQPNELKTALRVMRVHGAMASADILTDYVFSLLARHQMAIGALKDIKQYWEETCPTTYHLNPSWVTANSTLINVGEIES